MADMSDSCIDRWQDHENTHNPNIFGLLYQNLAKYQKAFKNQRKNNHQNHLKCYKSCDTDKSIDGINLGSITTQIPISKQNGSQRAPKTNPYRKKVCEGIRTRTSQTMLKRSSQCKQNKEGNLGKQSFKSKQRCLNESLINIRINQVKFDKLAANNKKKRDRYRQIFGQKPKFVLKKIGEQRQRNSDYLYNKLR